MKLETLKNVKSLDQKVIDSIYGGSFACESKKKDSDSNDHYSLQYN